ncbi:MAG: hypothetical protein N2512_12340 [Armatimonadetes bacterium]|nr:hypothetical protein [Armatimonadota bacterium]
MRSGHVAWGLIAAGLVAVLWLGGCTKAAQVEAQGGPQTNNPSPGMMGKVTAWINVSSGCQEPTVQLIQRLAEQYKGRVEVEIVDFGTPEGAQRWQEAGLDCMAIQFNGADAVTFPAGAGTKTVVFRMPEGFLWEHVDLITAFDALASGTLHPATEQEIAELFAPVQIHLKVRAQDVREIDDGRYAQLVVDGVAIARLYGQHGGKTPAQRCKAAKEALMQWTSKPVSPEDLSVAKSKEGWGVYANETLVLLVTDEEAKAYGVATSPRALAEAWLRELRKVVSAAVQKVKAEQKAAAAQAAAQSPAGAGPAGQAPRGQGQ